MFDAERADHFTVLSAGADQHADTRAHHQNIKEDGNHQATPR